MTLELDPATLPSLANNPVFIGHAKKADLVWTRDDFTTLCRHMLNGNPSTDFLMVYRDREGRPKFAKSKNGRAERYATWAFDTIRGKSKSPVGIGFYPSNTNGQSRWGAMDFDAHNGEGLRARGFALAAFDVLHRQPQLYIALGTSGSEGWHLFAFTDEFHPVGEWTRMLRNVANTIGAKVAKGVCELFPDEHRPGVLPYGIRAPGTWNPKHDTFGEIVFQSTQPLLDSEKKRKSSSFLYHATSRVNDPVLHDREKRPVFRGPRDSWVEQFRISRPASRHERLKELLSTIFRQSGREIALENARLQYLEATVQPQATGAEHGEEAEVYWRWLNDKWAAELSEREREKYGNLNTQTQRDFFRIVQNFARNPEPPDSPDFPLSTEAVGDRMGCPFQTISAMRKRFAELGVIKQTQAAIPNKRAARFRWVADASALDPF